MKESLRGKTVVVVISGLERLSDILEHKAPDTFPKDDKPLSYDPNKKGHVTRQFMRKNFPGVYDKPTAQL